MIRLLYSIAYLLALPLVFPAQYAKRPRDIKSRWLSQKLGKVEAIAGDGPLLWVHAVSVGETIAATTFIKAFIKRHPHYRVVVSTITDTGQKVATEGLKGIADVIYLPFDLPVFLNRAISTLKPSLFVVMETEIWPNLFHCMNKAGVPVALLNGRISEKSFASYMKIRPAIKSVLKNVDLLSMQDAVYVERIIKLGADVQRVHEAGSFKFDMDIASTPLLWADTLKDGGPVLVAGSTHRGEDELIADAYVKLKTTHKGLALILVPRHPERADEVEALLKQRGISCQRLTAISQGDKANEDVVLVDTVGVLNAIYERADIAVIGGSFIPHGGQNPLEPAYWGKAIVCGESMSNFPFISDFYDAGAAIEASAHDLTHILEGLLNSPERRASMGNKAMGLLDKSKGAVSRALDKVDSLIKS